VTDHITESIDRALSDVTVSGDAMRCPPEPRTLMLSGRDGHYGPLGPPVTELLGRLVLFDEDHPWRRELGPAPLGAAVFVWRDHACAYVVTEPQLVPPGVDVLIGYEEAWTA
jgi:hypothetical protein